MGGCCGGEGWSAGMCVGVCCGGERGRAGGHGEDAKACGASCRLSWADATGWAIIGASGRGCNFEEDAFVLECDMLLRGVTGGGWVDTGFGPLGRGSGVSLKTP